MVAPFTETNLADSSAPVSEVVVPNVVVPNVVVPNVVAQPNVALPGYQASEAPVAGNHLNRYLALAIYLTGAFFFLAEMLLKPVSGEDLHQMQCGMPHVFGSMARCLAWRMNTIPRVTQIFHYFVIPQFANLPSFGIETIIRLANATVAFGIFWLITTLALGRRPRLRLLDASLFAIVFVLATLNPINQVFFNGFSNVQIYIYTMLANLVAIYTFASYDRLLARFGRIPSWLITFIAFFIASSGFDIGSIVLPLLFLGVLLARQLTIRSKLTALAGTWAAPMPWLPAVLGWLAGLMFYWVIGSGIANHTQLAERDAALGLGGLSLIYTLISNSVINFTSLPIFPYLVTAVLGVVAAHRLSWVSNEQRRAVTMAAMFGFISLAGLAPTTSIAGRVAAAAFVALLVPLAFLAANAAHIAPAQPVGAPEPGLPHLAHSATASIVPASGYPVKQVAHSRIPALLGALALTALLAMTIDNTATLVTNLQRTSAALERVALAQCLDRAMVDDANILQESQLFRIRRWETPFSHVFTDWYRDEYLLNGQLLPIMDDCSLAVAGQE